MGSLRGAFSAPAAVPPSIWPAVAERVLVRARANVAARLGATSAADT